MSSTPLRLSSDDLDTFLCNADLESLVRSGNREVLALLREVEEHRFVFDQINPDGDWSSYKLLRNRQEELKDSSFSDQSPIRGYARNPKGKWLVYRLPTKVRKKLSRKFNSLK